MKMVEDLMLDIKPKPDMEGLVVLEILKSIFKYFIQIDDYIPFLEILRKRKR